MNRAELARYVDHTLLAPEAGRAAVAALVDEAVALGVFAVCVAPSQLPLAAKGLRVATVCGFPSGAEKSEVKAFAAARAVADGADEIHQMRIAQRTIAAYKDHGTTKPATGDLPL